MALNTGHPLLPVMPPEIGRPVRAVLKHFNNWSFHTDVVLVAVAEDDVNWRFWDDGAELAYDWHVVFWEYAESALIHPQENGNEPA